LRAAAAFAALLLLAAGSTEAQPAAGKLKVCADPNNLPFSNRAGQGFENQLAHIWASALGLEVEYTWFPQRRGFERHTLTAQDPVTGTYLCDVIVGVPEGYDLAMTTRPYYRSTYALVYAAGRGLDLHSGQDLIDLPPEKRDALRIGVFTPSPAAQWLALHDMYQQMVPYSILQGDPNAYPGQIIENQLVRGELDAAIVWGPIAGYYAARAKTDNLVVVPLRSEPEVRFDFAIAAAVRFGDRKSKAMLEDVMTRTRAETDRLLAEYHVPLVAESGRTEPPATAAAETAPSTAAAETAPPTAAAQPAAPPTAAAQPAAPPTAARSTGAAEQPQPERRGELVYVTNEDGGTISIISTATQQVVGEVQVGTRPRGVEVNAVGDRVYVALSGSPKCPPTMPDEQCEQLRADKSKDGIGVVDARATKVVRVLPGGSDPEAFDVDPRGTRLFVSNEDAGQLSIVDIESGEVTHTVDVGREPEGVRLSPDGKSVYVTSESDNAIAVVDAFDGKVLNHIPVGTRPRAAVFSADGARAYVSLEFGMGVAVIDVPSSKVLKTIALPLGSRPMGLALAPDGHRLYVSTGRAKTVAVIDTGSGQVVGQVEVGARPWGIGLTQDGKLLYTANGPSNDVSVVDTESLKVVATIPVGRSPWGIAVGHSPPDIAIEHSPPQ
jgi:quinoprotein dehydrogenase-associated probable ABC transporter substrate-binding protein